MQASFTAHCWRIQDSRWTCCNIQWQRRGKDVGFASCIGLPCLVVDVVKLWSPWCAQIRKQCRYSSTGGQDFSCLWPLQADKNVVCEAASHTREAGTGFFLTLRKMRLINIVQYHLNMIVRQVHEEGLWMGFVLLASYWHWLRIWSVQQVVNAALSAEATSLRLSGGSQSYAASLAKLVNDGG